MKFRSKHGGEWFIRRDLVRFLNARGWHVEITHGNRFQQGFPDLFIAHPKYGTRWIDVKQPGGYSFTKAQRKKWPVWERSSVGIWILTAATQDEYDKLFGLPNWRDYWKPSWGPIDADPQALIDALLDEIDAELGG